MVYREHDTLETYSPWWSTIWLYNLTTPHREGTPNHIPKSLPRMVQGQVIQSDNTPSRGYPYSHPKHITKNGQRSGNIIWQHPIEGVPPVDTYCYTGQLCRLCHGNRNQYPVDAEVEIVKNAVGFIPLFHITCFVSDIVEIVLL